MPVFARNGVCLLFPAAFGATAKTMLDKMLGPGVHIGGSPAKIDPHGDYTVRLFEMAEHFRPGSTAALQERAVVIDVPPGSPPPKSGDADVDPIPDHRIDAGIVYCSGRDRYAHLLPDATLVAFPPALRVGPEYGLAMLNNAPPEALLLAQTILSPAGQKVLADRGFQPVALPDE